MHILRPPSPPASAPAPAPVHRAGVEAGLLRCRVRLTDGRVFTGELPAARHRSLQLGLLHEATSELVELTPGTRRADGVLHVDRRRDAVHYLAGGGSGTSDWLRALLAHADRIVSGDYARAGAGERPSEEVFVGVAPRTRPTGARDAVDATRWLWLDVDRPDALGSVWSFLAERPCHLLIASGGSGGVHAYWKLTEPLPAHWERPDGVETEPIERAHQRIIHALGEEVADPRCAERSRLMRLAGTINHKSGRWAHILEADLALEPYDAEDLVGDLPDSPGWTSKPPTRATGDGSGDPYKQIPPPEYFKRLAGLDVPRGGLVSCPVPQHRDRHPSCKVGTLAKQGWCCHSASCGARGAIYDLASVLIGGPWGPQLRGAAFARARAHVIRVVGRLP
ncbi:hypothetical protein C8N24_0655 [Solirubrobacter pauli]|uniref:Uncharacterized protein n=1 Tax=Solirubrobacter pauli TaxID=166793 RepID=A0A660LA53_9ACTN|nr:hypothetical protein C8N24_0655 [Solirubrobacter pauli]